MGRQRALEMALDLARMPAIAQPMSAAPLPGDVLEVIRIAAEEPDACRSAALNTGVSEKVLIEASRFYLQQVLFRPNADCYRILGIAPDAPRALARDHMRWLLQWLHPDRNGGWEAVYAKQIVNAWRELSNQAAAPETFRPRGKRTRSARSVRLPLIERPLEKSGRWRSFPPRGFLKIAGGVLTILLLLALIVPTWEVNLSFSEISRRASDCFLALHCAW
jgi:hypothetical protein